MERQSPVWKEDKHFRNIVEVGICLVILELESDDFILEIFQSFFAMACENHLENVFASMLTIMTMRVKPSRQLASVLSTNVKRDKREFSPTMHGYS